MGSTTKRTALAFGLLLFATACNGRGGSTGSRRGGLPETPLTAMLSIVTQWPQDSDQYVPVSAGIAVKFDAPLHPGSLNDGLTYLVERDTDAPVAAKLLLDGDNTTLVIQPNAELRHETWYTVHLSPLLCDSDERLLEEDRLFSFKTADTTAPKAGGTSIPNNAKNVARSVVLRVTFDEPIDPRSVHDKTVLLTDSAERSQVLELEVHGTEIQIKPQHDLAPATDYVLTVVGGAAGVRDLASNPLEQSVTLQFTTEADNAAPQLVATYPDTPLAAPMVQVQLTFDEAMDLDSIESTAFSFKDQYGSFVPYSIEAEPNHRVLRLVPTSPLRTGNTYIVRVNSGPGAITDLSGKPLATSHLITFVVGEDTTPPILLESSPTNNENRIDATVRPTFKFQEPLDPSQVNEDAIRMVGENGAIQFVLRLTEGDSRVTLEPVEPLRVGQRYTVTFVRGPAGIRDRVGNFLPGDIALTFFTTTDRTPPAMTISPTHGHSAMPPYGTYTAAFEEPLDPGTVNAQTVIVTDSSNQVVPGTVTLGHDDRIITFTPSVAYKGGTWHTVTLRAGPSGIRERSGNWLDSPVSTGFRAAFEDDTVPPNVTVSINGTADLRKQGLSVATSGFELTVYADDPINYDVDLGSFEVEIRGSGSVPTPAMILAGATLTKDGLSYVIPPQQKLAPGDYTLVARVADMAGNYTTAEALQFRVVDFDAATMPFERTQVVWVRFDLDRDGNQRADFEDDLVRLGLITPDDPSGTNQRMIEIMRRGVLAAAHQIFERKANGGRRDAGSVALLFTDHQPIGVPYTQMAMGGLDPSAAANRGYGDKSSGILGRALFDARNSARSDDNTATSPALGVFGGELFLFEVETHQLLYPTFITTFAKRFMKLVPQMGGTSVGAHSLDTIVTAREFDFSSATAPEQRRYDDIFLAADDWASAMGVVLAHEVGHTIGLVASGPPPGGLHGDASLHNRYPNLGDVMSSAVGYDSMVSLKYRFRDLNVAYLRQRVLLK